MSKITGLAALAAAVLMTVGAAQAQSIVDRVKERGYVSCGASQGVPGLSRPDDQGNWTGFDVDNCRAVAAAVLGDATKAQFVPLNAAQRLPALQTGEIDVLSRTTTWTYSRDAAVRFVAINLIDGDAILLRKDLNVQAAKDIDGLTICLQGGGSLVENALDTIELQNDVTSKRVYFDSTILARDAYFAGRCDGYMSDGFAIAGQRAAVAGNPDNHVIFMSGATSEPLAIAVPRGDERWFDIVRYAFNVMVWAEDKGIGSANVDEIAASSADPEVRKVLGVEPGIGEPLGLDDRWAYSVIKQVGNYGEVFDRNLGANSPLNAERRLNALYRDGGILFPIAFK
jgi:general L-amino acid transport system substrate-binding protein